MTRNIIVFQKEHLGLITKSEDPVVLKWKRRRLIKGFVWKQVKLIFKILLCLLTYLFIKFNIYSYF
ncbi:hypothetical protein DMZ48_16735 [Robertkochia solimangrovi]|nr:hypothetical protein DMZ48_16735 [Robertkochia solimangrovi]